eukprot:9487180-Pyramimonas_sp.AAC.1
MEGGPRLQNMPLASAQNGFALTVSSSYMDGEWTVLASFLASVSRLKKCPTNTYKERGPLSQLNYRSILPRDRVSWMIASEKHWNAWKQGVQNEPGATTMRGKPVAWAHHWAHRLALLGMGWH